MFEIEMKIKYISTFHSSVMLLELRKSENSLRAYTRVCECVFYFIEDVLEKRLY